VCKAKNLPPSSADVTESGSFNLPEPSGPHRPVMGMLYVFNSMFSSGSFHEVIGVEEILAQGVLTLAID
jgi:hypothetical protein